MYGIASKLGKMLIHIKWIVLAKENNFLLSRPVALYIHSRSLNCVKTFYKIFDMHMILGSLESDFKRALIDTKISQIACWEHY